MKIAASLWTYKNTVYDIPISILYPRREGSSVVILTTIHAGV